MKKNIDFFRDKILILFSYDKILIFWGVFGVKHEKHATD